MLIKNMRGHGNDSYDFQDKAQIRSSSLPPTTQLYTVMMRAVEFYCMVLELDPIDCVDATPTVCDY